MLTRRAAAAARQQVADKLQLTLLELKTSKELCAQLLSEREDSERELLLVLDSRDMLKKELCSLESSYNDVNSERARLQEMVDRFAECGATYEEALKDINSLERALHDAHEQIYKLREAQNNAAAAHTQSLFEELVGPGSQLVTPPIENPVVTIDLTNDSAIPRLVNCSGNKLKKYAKLNRIIRKTQKLTKQNKLFFKKLSFCKINVNLVDKLDVYSAQLQNSRSKYEIDTQEYKFKIQSLEDSIESLNKMNESSKKVISEYSLAMDDLISQINYNSERFESLTNGQSCLCKQVSGHLSTGDSNSSLCASLPSQEINNKSSLHTTPKCTPRPNAIMYCDEIGNNMGTFLNHHVKGLSTISNCLPYSSLDNLLNQIFNDKNIHSKTTLLVLMGNRGNVNKNNLIEFLEKLNTLIVKKVILFTFPYSSQMSKVENDTRYKLNISLYNCCTYTNKFSIIDINKYVNKKNMPMFFLTEGKFYLSNYCKRQIALSLSYLLDISAKNLAHNSAPIEQINVNLELVPILTNNLN
jgi:transposase